MKRYHDEARGLLLDEKSRLDYLLTIIKAQIAETCRKNPYGADGSGLMKRQHALVKRLADVELSMKVLKQDAQRRIQEDWDLKQAKISRKTEGSYNCMYGC